MPAARKSKPAPRQPRAAARTAPKGISLRAHRGSGSTLLAMDLAKDQLKDFAGFALWRTAPGGHPEALVNRLSFDTHYTKDTTAEQRTWTPSNEAPFQKFRWTDFTEGLPGTYTYRATAMHFDRTGGLREGASAEARLELEPSAHGAYQLGFTRGYLSSQAYAERFKNADVRPQPKTLDYDPAKFRAQYEWLGYHARRLLEATLDEAVKDKAVTVDALVFDFDDVETLHRLEALGKRLRIVMDDSGEHQAEPAKPGKKAKAPPLELAARARLAKTAGAANVKTGHFARFAHCKVFVLRRNGVPYKVLTGSANFSVRGLYVQANNVLLFDDREVAAAYGKAFEQSFKDPTGAAPFNASDVARQWHTFQGAGVRNVQVAFSPHKDSTAFLGPVAQAMDGAKKSVLFAVMQMAGGGPVMDALRNLRGKGDVFSYGITQTYDDQDDSKSGVQVEKPDGSTGALATFAALDKHVPANFRKEWSGGPGQVIHHKFIVCDAGTPQGVVFTGSSNLADGGEEANGDNLIAIRDPATVDAFAVEAIRLFDHYHFRDAMRSATDEKPLTLQGPGAQVPWWTPYYDPQNVKMKDRLLFGQPVQ
jgi:phosphatidylserine/phosphatidylglycerophosphate/cardiolipin synthase-like enzyme